MIRCSKYELLQPTSLFDAEVCVIRTKRVSKEPQVFESEISGLSGEPRRIKTEYYHGEHMHVSHTVVSLNAVTGVKHAAQLAPQVYRPVKYICCLRTAL